MKDVKHSAFRIWITTFLLEKGIYSSIESKLLLSDAKGAENHFNLTAETLIEFLDSAKPYQAQIKETFVKIDFLNGDCEHYLKFLTNGMFAQMRSTSMFPEMFEIPYTDLK